MEIRDKLLKVADGFMCPECDRGWNEGDTCAGKFPDDCPAENAREHNCEFCPSHRPHCPSCNKGRVQLAVECECCREGGIFDVDMPKCTNGYRPLTNDEVEHLVDSYNDTFTDIDRILEWLGNGDNVEFKGSQVVLIPTTN